MPAPRGPAPDFEWVAGALSEKSLAGFAGKRGVAHVVALSSSRSRFAEDYGAQLVDGPQRGSTARAAVVLDEIDAPHL